MTTIPSRTSSPSPMIAALEERWSGVLTSTRVPAAATLLMEVEHQEVERALAATKLARALSRLTQISGRAKIHRSSANRLAFWSFRPSRYQNLQRCHSREPLKSAPCQRIGYQDNSVPWSVGFQKPLPTSSITHQQGLKCMVNAMNVKRSRMKGAHPCCSQFRGPHR